MTQQSGSSSKNTADQSKIDQMIARGKDLEEGETLNLDDLPENPKTPLELWQEGLLQGDGAKQHAFADAQARGVLINNLEESD